MIININEQYEMANIIFTRFVLLQGWLKDYNLKKKDMGALQKKNLF